MDRTKTLIVVAATALLMAGCVNCAKKPDNSEDGSQSGGDKVQLMPGDSGDTMQPGREMVS